MSGATAEANGRLWGARARDWADVQEGQFAAAYHAVLRHAAVGPGTRHMDAGCGSGMAAALSATLGARIAGIDAAQGMLEIARERTPAGDFRHGDLESLPFNDDAFDLVTGFNAFQFAGNPGAAQSGAGHAARRQDCHHDLGQSCGDGGGIADRRDETAFATSTARRARPLCPIR